MARIRQIKPEIRDNEDLARLSRDHRLCFIFLWHEADRQGRLEDRPARLKIRCFPYDEDLTVARFDQLLADLAQAGFLERYEAEGQRVILVRTFVKHQKPHPNEPPSVLPPPPSCPHPAAATLHTTPRQTPSRPTADDPVSPSVAEGETDRASADGDRASTIGTRACTKGDRTSDIGGSPSDNVRACSADSGFLVLGSGRSDSGRSDSGFLRYPPAQNAGGCAPPPAEAAASDPPDPTPTARSESPPVPLGDLERLWNTTAAAQGWPQVRAVREWPPGRLAAAKARAREHPTVAWWLAYFARMQASDLLAGRMPRQEAHASWRPDFDWALKPGTVAKVLEGKYDNRAGSSSGASASSARLRANLAARDQVLAALAPSGAVS